MRLLVSISRAMKATVKQLQMKKNLPITGNVGKNGNLVNNISATPSTTNALECWKGKTWEVDTTLYRSTNIVDHNDPKYVFVRTINDMTVSCNAFLPAAISSAELPGTIKLVINISGPLVRMKVSKAMYIQQQVTQIESAILNCTSFGSVNNHFVLPAQRHRVVIMKGTICEQMNTRKRYALHTGCSMVSNWSGENTIKKVSNMVKTDNMRQCLSMRMPNFLQKRESWNHCVNSRSSSSEKFTPRK
mmetsp:Transcript_65754/g.174299  ORF Transcript_65754/g.174299 Transcript_65754/m.174299 type:complete len:246 (-) Transcript_65754:1993-2730(-)